YEKAAQAPRLPADLRDDFASYFAECTVRAVELKLRHLSPSERDAAFDRDDADGYVLVRPLFASLSKYEASEPSMALYFPDLVRSIDLPAESKRLESVHFATASAVTPDDAAAESVVRRKAFQPTTVPNDTDAIAALTEGERHIAEKNPRAAEASFQKVLA